MSSAVPALVPAPTPESGADKADLLSLPLSTSTATASSSTATELSSTTTISPSNAMEEISKSTSTSLPSNKLRVTPGVETVIITTSIVAILALLIFLGWACHRKHRQQNNDGNSTGSSSTGSSRGASEASTRQGAPATGPLPKYNPPTMQERFMPIEDPFTDPKRYSSLTNNAVDRQERLGLVRADLLAPREANPADPNMRYNRSNGDNTMDGLGLAGLGLDPPMRTVWPTGRDDSPTVPPLNIEAGGQWDSSRKVAMF
ncbi:hypothetical protein BUE80_DR001577 [Diplocarpon rosae]|nr:hypothetical protein BUE80_DR001577 [Diplocarpon rosae]